MAAVFDFDTVSVRFGDGSDDTEIYAMSYLPDLITPRLVLRPLVPGDEERLFCLRTNEEVNRYLDRPQTRERAEVCRFIEAITEGIAEYHWTYWALTLGDGELIGTICLWNFSEDRRTAELGYEIHPDFQGRGLMDEAVKKVIRYGFDILGLRRINAETHRLNQRSVALLVKNGFVRDPLKDDGACIGYALLIGR